MPRKFLITGLLVASLLLHLPAAAAAIISGDTFTYDGDQQKELIRGEAVSYIVQSFNLRKKFRSFIHSCLSHMDDCFFVFSTMSDYDGISFAPLILYPDVFPAHENYQDINMATILGLVHGFIGETNSPFHPEIAMTRIQALKVVLGAADLMKWKDQFELSEDDKPTDLPFTDPELKSPDSWWYPRYLKMALDKGIIDAMPNFEPDRAITEAELTGMVTRSLAVIDVVKAPADAKKSL